MDQSSANLLTRIDIDLEDDLIMFKLIKDSSADDKNKSEIKRQRHLEFVKYLISVATHPIGLRASVTPFSCSQEQMLAYIMKVFGLSENDVRDFMIGTTSAKVIPGNKSPGVDQTIKARKLHSWRPQLRVVLGVPEFFYHKQLHLDNLNVRVYLFKSEKVSVKNQTSKGDSNLTKGKSILENVFKRFRLDPGVLIRPVNEMRALIRYNTVIRVRRTPTNQPTLRSVYRMTLVSKDESKPQNELMLNIRRYYTDPKSIYILRFEFWLDAKKVKVGCLDHYRSCIRSLVFNEVSSCCRKGNRSVYMNENQDFYGYINVQLAQIPSYPIKQNYPILTLQEQKVNNCDISIEFTNRQIPHNEQQQKIVLRDDKDLVLKSKQESMIFHIRLYMNCLLYQILNLTKRNYKPPSSLTLDNIFYLPAYTLINQHRLQNNLTLTEDRCLRRISILLLLIKLNHLLQTTRSKPRITTAILLLVSIAQCEYMIASTKIDDKTMQEIDPFKSYSLNKQEESVPPVELITLRDFISKFLEFRLRKWLTKLSAPSDSSTERLITLSSLKMIKSALSHLIKSSFGIKPEFRKEVVNLKSSVDQLICDIVLNHTTSRLEKTIYSGEKHINRKERLLEKKKIKPVNLWLELFNEIKYIDNDICLYWSSKGVNGVILKEQEFVKNSTLFEKLNEQECFEILRRKVEKFVL